MFFTVPIAATLVVETLGAPYAAQIGGGPAIAGLLMGASPAGIVVGLWLLPQLIPDQRAVHVAVLSVLSGAPLVVFLLVPSAWLACLLVVVGGVALYFWIPLAAEFTQTVPDAMRGQAVGLLTTTMRVTQGLAILTFGLVAQYASPSLVIAVGGALGTALAVVLSAAWARTSEEPAAEPQR